ncbi:hypothetical protein D3C81_1585620 [compost metagenome]
MAVIDDAEPHIFARRQLKRPGQIAVQHYVFAVDIDCPACWQGIAGIDADVEQGAFQLRRVDERWPQLRIEVTVQRD